MESELQLPPRHPIRRALCISVKYEHVKDLDTLDTSSYDPPKIRDLLIGKHVRARKLCENHSPQADVYGWEESEITILSDDPPGQYELPTRETMLREMRNLVQDARPGDRFVFQFSGHGAQKKNKDGKEKDGYDEVIFPYDVEIDPRDEKLLQSSNSIMDDEINDILVKSLPGGSQLSMIFDCCHSGTAADLPHDYEDECTSPLSPISVPIDDGNPFIRTRKRGFTVRGRDAGSPTVSPVAPSWESDTSTRSNDKPYVVCWSACKDNQLAFERPGDTGGGLFVEAFTQALRRNPRHTHNGLLGHIREIISDIVRESIDYTTFKKYTNPLQLPLNPQWSSNLKIAEIAEDEVMF
ncbi:hypothetical protein QCA50_020252 [Cerrena zonata]|uniref:Peptidase C14 caspase domain-containing protein n=1 Tax=Cerrena zonata TaxID=2478898 RepID=A0AAW0FC43_9APHY